MTYPPQPGQPYGQQPDPYGQGQGGYPQSGGFQQPGQYGQQQPGYDQYGQQQQPGYDPYGQQQQQQGYDQTQQYQGYPQQGGYGAPPPQKKSMAGLWIGLAIGAVVLITVGITGFVAPGFFLSDDEGPEGTTNAIVAALNTQDKTAMQGLICADASEVVKAVPDNLDDLSAARLVSGPTKKSDTEYVATVEVTEKKDNDTTQFDGTVVKAGDKWCWKALGDGPTTGSKSEPTSKPKTSSSPKSSSSKPSSSPGGSGQSDGKALIDDFISKVNSGDKAGALAMACSSTASLLETTVGYAIDGQGNYSVASAPPDETLVSADITGTESGRSVSGSVSATNFDDAGFCISTFYAF
ncbi:hypothetical protein [Amycolatopsis magusensis]|uniref:hypothetical protein n=1 Tax=Amycolatopsis magusensis TaxID=882444 RepID=UPI0037A24AE8